MFPVPQQIPFRVQETFLAETCNVEADAWFLSFYQVLESLECEFAKKEDVGIALPDGARCTPASRTLSPDCGPDIPRLQDCFVVIAWTASRKEAYLQRGSVACCRFIVPRWSLHWPAPGPPAGSLLEGSFSVPVVPAIKDTYSQYNENDFNLSACKGGGGGKWTQMLYVLSYNLVTGHDIGAYNLLNIL